MSGLLMLLPDAFLPLIVVALALALILGIVKLHQAGAILGGIALIALSGPLIEGIFASLPMWILLFVLALFGLMVLRWLLEALIGSEGTGHVLGAFTVMAVVGACRLALFPLRALGWMVRTAARMVFGP